MNIIYHYLLAFIIRLALIIYGAIQDNSSMVKYTDVDYQVFSDAAEYVLKGDSPFKRHTYRYTPFLAYMLTPNITLHNAFGKFLFCLLDIVTSILIYQIVRSYGYASDICKKSLFIWIYNPITMVISSRGNAESIMTTLVMLSIYFYQKDRPTLCGIVYGLSVHFKIYPCIYALSFYFSLSTSINRQQSTWKKFKVLFLPEKRKTLFVCCSVIGFAIPTAAAFILCGDEYIREALLYHIVRKDIRHNFSPYFYFLYLSEVMDNRLSALLSVLTIVVQCFMIAFTAWVFHSPLLLPTSLFIQTFIFVTMNKVCTSQYFLWYLCLFPLTYPLLKINLKKIILAFIIWLSNQGLWLLPAFYLEFKGKNVFLFIYIAGLIFYSVNMYLICSFIKRLKSIRYEEIDQKID